MIRRTLAISASLALAALASAQVQYQTSFEGPGFSPGNVVNQQGWVTDFGGSSGSITNALARTGTQSLRIDTTFLILQGWWYRPLNLNAAGRVVDISWSMYIDPEAPTDRASFGIDVYNADLESVCALWVDGPAGGRIYHGQGVPTDVVVPVRSWRDYKLRLNYANATYQAFYDGVVVGSGSLVAGQLTSPLADADVWADDSTATGDLAFYDDYKVEFVTVAPTCIADVDDGSGTGAPDGGVTIEDLLYYLVVFGDGAVRADVDDGSGTGTPDGGVTIEDLLYFLLRFTAGC